METPLSRISEKHSARLKKKSSVALNSQIKLKYPTRGQMKQIQFSLGSDKAGLGMDKAQSQVFDMSGVDPNIPPFNKQKTMQYSRDMA